MMASKLRMECQHLMEGYAEMLDLHDARILDVGIAGDPPPGENFKWFGKNGNTYETLDILEEWKPTHVGDICDPPFDKDTFDLVILSNTLEHVFDYEAALRGVSKITKQWAIIDIPWMYPYHPELGYEDYWRMSKAAFHNLLPKFGFTIEHSVQTDNLTSALCRKK